VKILRAGGDARGADEGGATLVTRAGVVDAVEADADPGLAGDAIEVVGVDSTRVVVAEVVDVVDADAIFSAVEDAISAVGDAITAVAADAISVVAADAISLVTAGGGVDDAVEADAGAATARGAIAVDLSTPQLSTK